MPEKKISIHDLARQLNVSSATISFVLNGKASEKRISRAVENKILKYVQKSGYRPNRVAKSLRTGKSGIIGMLVEGISDPFFASIARIVEKEIHQYDYKIFYASTNNDPIIAKELIRAYRDTQVDGYIIAPPPGIGEDVKSLLEDGFPVVLFDRYFPELPTHNVVADNFDGAYQATLHFIQNGYKKIGIVTLDSAQIQMEERLRGYLKAMEEYGLKPLTGKISYDRDQDHITGEIKSFLDRKGRPDAVLFATNYLAVKGLKAIADLNYCVPEDIAVIGFDDNSHFSLFSPSITAVAQPVEAISRAVVEKLMACLTEGDKPPPKGTVVFPTRLVVRQSSVKPSKELKPPKDAKASKAHQKKSSSSININTAI
jgi:LacI family transcriptional regulator